MCGGPASGGNPPTGLTALKEHVENLSADGNLRIGVAMIDPKHAKSPTYAADVLAVVAAAAQFHQPDDHGGRPRQRR